MPIAHAIILVCFDLGDADIFVTLNFVWALRAGERSSRVKIADRRFASRQSASFVPIKRGEF
jgi:hypothetical protein